MQGEDINLWVDRAQLILKLQQAEKLLTAQSDLIDGTFFIFLKAPGSLAISYIIHSWYYLPLAVPFLRPE